MVQARLSVLLAVCVAVACAANAPNVLYSVNPNPNGVSSQVATCPPTVVSAESAFVCYHPRGMNDTFQYVNPSNPTFTGAQATTSVTSAFVFPPIALSRLTAVAYSANPQSSEYIMFSAVSPSIKTVNRQGSTAGVVYAPDLNLTIVPIGKNLRVGNYDSIVAFAVNAATEAESIAWSMDFPLPDNFPLTTQISTPVYYRGTVIVVAGQVLYVLNATALQPGTQKPQIIFQATNPCGFQFDATQLMRLFVVTFGSDANGSLDAFILSANTTGADGIAAGICRVSHRTGALEWIQTYDKDVNFIDVVGSNSTITCTGWVGESDGTTTNMVWSLDASTGAQKDVINREIYDQFNFPAFLPQAIGGCAETMVLQVGGNLTAYCTGAYSAPVWVSQYPCNHRAAIDPVTNRIACVSRGASVHLLDTDGTLIWINDQIEAIFAASIVSGVVWVVDLTSTLWGLSLAPSATPLPPPYFPNQGSPSQGLGGGAVAGIVLTVFVVGAAIGAAVVAYSRFTKRRSAYQATVNDHENVRGGGGYGSLTGDA